MLGTGEILLCPLACDQIHDLRLFPGEGPTCQDCKVPAGLVSPPTPPTLSLQVPCCEESSSRGCPWTEARLCFPQVSLRFHPPSL